MKARTAILLALLPLACACAARAPGSRAAAPRSGDPYRITTAELATSTTTNLYDAIVQLRPLWISRRIPTADARTGSRYAVYLDRNPFGDLDALRSIPVRDVLEVRLQTPSQAMGEFDSDQMLGAIQVITRRRR